MTAVMAHTFFALRVVVSALFLGVGLTSHPAFAQPGSALDHPSIREILAMVEAGVGEDVILARVGQMDSLPLLRGEEIAALKRKGVPDRVLLLLVEGSGAEDKELSPPRGPGGTAHLKVILESSFPLTFYEVVVDAQVIRARGKKYEGESEPGRALRQPSRFELQGSEVVYEQVIDPGEHRILVGFAVTRVERDRRDDWMEYGRERYVSSGVAAQEGAGSNKVWGTNQGAVCRVAAGQVCVVTARFEKGSPTPFGGLPAYSLTYLVDVSPE